MLCCVSRKASARPNNPNNQQQQQQLEKHIDSDCSASSSGFSESSTASSGDFASSGITRSSSSSNSTSGFSSASPASLFAFANSTSDSSSSNSEPCNRFDLPIDYLAYRSTPNNDHFPAAAARDSSSFSSPSTNGLPPPSPRRLQTFSTPASVQDNTSNFRNDEALVEMEKLDEDEPPALLPCAICARTFMPQSLEKHKRICERAAAKKRKPFDSAKQRIQGTDLAEFLPKETVKRKVYQEEKTLPPIAPAAASKGSWKQTHAEFIRAIRAARAETVDEPQHHQRQVVAPSNVTVGVPTRPNEKGMCPTCNRQFSIKSYERHVAWCKEHATRVQISPATNVAKERLEARMKYRAPLLKNRRLTNREKYSPGSAVNLSSYGNKNSLANQRAKESASTPNCNNKGGNEAAVGGAAQNHQKTAANARHAGQGREGISSGPMKSRLSDRSSRPSAEIESGPTTNPSSRCPIPPRTNAHQQHSPLSTSRSFSTPESARTASQDCRSTRRVAGSDRRSIELNIFDGAKLHQRENIVSARSHGCPKVNDIAINDQVIGMTVHRCGLHRNSEQEKKPVDGLITWKQISEDKNLVKRNEFLRLNHRQNLEETELILPNESSCSLKSSLDFRDSERSGVKKLNQTYLIGESLEAEKNLAEILGRRMRGPVANNPRMEIRYAAGKIHTLQKNDFKDLGSDENSPRRFNAEINATSSPLKCRRECREDSDKIFSRARAKLAPLDLKMMLNDEFSDQEDTSRSEASTQSSLQTCRRKLTKRTPKLKPITGQELICEKSSNSTSSEEENGKNLENSKHCVGGFERLEGNKQLLTNSQSPESTAIIKNNFKRSVVKNSPTTKPINSEELDGEKELSLRFCNEENADNEHRDESIEDIEQKLNIDERNQMSHNSRLSELLGRFRKKLDEDKSLDSISCKDGNRGRKNEKISVCYTKASESLDEGNHTNLINIRHSLQDVRLNVNHDEIFESLITSRSAKSAVTTMKSCRSSSSKETFKLLVETELSCHESLNNDFCSERINDYSIEQRYKCCEAQVSEEKIENNETSETLESKLSSIEKSFDTLAENDDQPIVESVEISAGSLESEKTKNIAIESPKNYQRCGTYVIDRATNSNVRTNQPASDESLEEKPLLKRRRTDQDVTNDEIKKASISREETADEKRSKDLESEKKLTNLQNCSSDSPVKPTNDVKSSELEIEAVDRVVDEIDEKYVNRNFDYDSDNTGCDGNLVKDNDPEDLIATQEKLYFRNETSSYDLNPKAFSDSIVPRKTSSPISSLKSQNECFVRDSVETRRKLKKKMSLVRGSTDSLISSMEASDNKGMGEKSSSIVDSCEVEKAPRVEEETIRELDLATLGKIAASKTSCCSFLPEIPVDRIIARSEDRKETKIGKLDATCFWEKARKRSSTRLINLDPPKCRESRIRNARQSNVGNLPPVVPASFRKERRSGSCKDYDPFLLAERQMNELLSDTCSDQSFTDSPGNRRGSLSPSSPNYPLSHSSAFVKYPEPVTRNLNNPDKRASLIAPPSEFDDLAADSSSDSTETNSISRELLADLEDSRARENGLNHESKSRDSRDHVLGRRVIIDKSKALGTTNEIIEDSVRKNSQTNEKARKILEKVAAPKVLRPHVTRSSSVRATSAPKPPERKNNNISSLIMSNKINSRTSPGSVLNNRNNNYASLSGSNVSLSSIVSSEVEVKRSNSLFDELASSFEDDVSGTYPSLRSLLKNDSLSVSSPVQSNRPRNGQISDEELSSPDSYQRQDHNKLSADSAYSSLNRKYSNHGRSTNDVAGRLEEDSPHRRREGDAGSTSSAKSKMSKFCHECGCRFPETAKFCCECGIRRLAL